MADDPICPDCGLPSSQHPEAYPGAVAIPMPDDMDERWEWLGNILNILEKDNPA